MSEIEFRDVETHSEYEQCVEIQICVWDIAVPAVELIIIHRYGGVCVGAFDDDKMVGFVCGIVGRREDRVFHHSHMLAVMPDYRGRGIGETLKWKQRDRVLAQGMDFMNWTFDPLQARNANLNLQALGAVSRTYFPNFYGLTPALCLGPGIPTDRLLVEWPIGLKRIREKGRRSSPRKEFDAEGLPKALERAKGGADPYISPSHPKADLRAPAVLVEVPPKIEALRDQPELIGLWQTGLRRVMVRYFERGYKAEDFLHGARSFYLLVKRGPSKSVET